MAGRGRPAHILPLHDPPLPLLARVPPPAPLFRAAEDALVARRHAVISLEERLASQLREIHILLNDNEELAASHVALKRDLDASQHELRVVAASAAESKAKADAEAREIFERSCKAESEVRLIERMRADMAQVQSDVRTFSAENEELTQKLQSLKGELARARSDHKEAATTEAEVEVMRKEIQKGRAAVEFEKKAHADNLEQSQIMENNMLLMTREVEKLRAELANIEKRARADAAAANSGLGYAGAYETPQIAYQTTSHAGETPQIAYQTTSYAGAYSFYQPTADGTSQFGSAAAPLSQYGIQQMHAHR
ncbi:protein FLX-like 1 [Zingiber officinale]|uniref:protein FLX-like 1 n=1 Tax=Zingiber officinale TaxID=94328 RepID=UPI001C4C7272|nr:protein FLX-like 1 [Zingiber officinale]